MLSSDADCGFRVGKEILFQARAILTRCSMEVLGWEARNLVECSIATRGFDNPYQQRSARNSSSWSLSRSHGFEKSNRITTSVQKGVSTTSSSSVLTPTVDTKIRNSTIYQHPLAELPNLSGELTYPTQHTFYPPTSEPYIIESSANPDPPILPNQLDLGSSVLHASYPEPYYDCYSTPSVDAADQKICLSGNQTAATVEPEVQSLDPYAATSNCAPWWRLYHTMDAVSRAGLAYGASPSGSQEWTGNSDIINSCANSPRVAWSSAPIGHPRLDSTSPEQSLRSSDEAWQAVTSDSWTDTGTAPPILNEDEGLPVSQTPNNPMRYSPGLSRRILTRPSVPAFQPVSLAKFRHHPLYNASPRPDGLYHCYKGCNLGHKPQKLKCNYDPSGVEGENVRECQDAHLLHALEDMREKCTINRKVYASSKTVRDLGTDMDFLARTTQATI
ncbi:hypothetical protein ABVK25_002983 [Lepraria finkii]|uniref:Uncharacterized protein n=1 Tax=Lepraria finkii TaxID=1340010 RepID=A0ABR4BFK4_9LECA